MSVILTCNAGSSNTKLAAFDARTGARRDHAVIPNDQGQIADWLNEQGGNDVAAVGHRVVHGGRTFTQPVRITDDVLEILQGYISLAPLHQPVALALIAQTRTLYSAVPQIACFDTAFHHTLPLLERRLPLPRALHDEGIQRYGFHGLSYQYIASILPQFLNGKASGRVVVAHLGGGASACAIRDGKSIASTMGFSTLDGLMMGTRCGALDPGAVLYLLQEKELAAEAVSNLLYRESGLEGVSGLGGDMQALLQSPRREAREAVELYGYLAAKQIAGLLPGLGGLDALVFTGGIGERAAPVRDHIAGLLRFAGNFTVHAIPTDEEAMLADACRTAIA